MFWDLSDHIKTLIILGAWHDSRGGGGCIPHNGLYGEAPPERGIFFRLQVYERVEILLVELYERVEKSVQKKKLKKPKKANRQMHFMAVKKSTKKRDTKF